MLSRLAALIALVVCVQSAFAIDKYWRPVTNDFHSAANWDPIGVPNSGDRVILDQFGQADMVISQNTTVGGWLQSNNYFGIVYLDNGPELTVGTQDFYLDSGGFYGQGGKLDCNGDCLVYGGGFQAPALGLEIAGDLYINPAPLGGWFDENFAPFTLDGFSWTNLVTNLTLSNLVINKGGGFGLVVPDGMFLQINGFTQLLDGVLTGSGELRVNGDCLVGSGHDGGTGTLMMTGSGTHILDMQKTNWDLSLLEINMGNPIDSVRLVSTVNNVDLQTSSDTLRISSGHFDIDYYGTITFNQEDIFIEPAGTLIAPPSTLNVERNWTNNGGTFEHNNGTVAFTAFVHGNITPNGTETFHNLQMNKPGGYWMTIADGTALRVENRMDFIDGLLQGLDGQLQAEDSLVVYSTHDTGNAPVKMVSDKVGNVIINAISAFFNDFDIEKDAPGDLVYFETNNGFLRTGTLNNHIDIDQGNLAFKDYGSYVDWNIPDIEIHAGGTLTAPDGTLICSGNLVRSGGVFDHNMGNWEWDAAVHRNLDVSGSIEFYNTRMNKSSGYHLFVGTNDSLVAVNRITFNDGPINNAFGAVIALDSVVVNSTHDRGTTPWTFMGGNDGHWIVNTIGNLCTDVKIQKQNPSVTVWATSTNAELEMGGFDEVLTIDEGTLGFENIGSIVDYDWSDTVILPGGILQPWSGSTYCSGNLTEQGGALDHNMSHWVFDHPVSRTLDVTDRIEFYDVEINKSSGFILTIATGDSLVALNRMNFVQGVINNADARVVARDSVVHYASHNRGTTPLVFMGPSDGHWIVNENGPMHLDVRVEKAAPGVTVWTTSDNTELELGETDEALTIDEGTLAFENIGSIVDLDYGSTTLETGGTLRAWSGATYHSGSLFEQGGTFEHNLGDWVFNTPISRTLDVTNRIQFHNVAINKTSGFILTIADGDSLVAENKFDYVQGVVNNSLARVVALDSVVHYSTHGRGTTPLVFMGAEDGHWIVNENGQMNFDVIIEKNDPSTTVWATSGLTELQMGETDETLTIEEGTLAFENINTHVNLDYGSTLINTGGTLRAWEGWTYHSGSLTEQGGTFEHNMGRWNFDASINRTLTVTDRIEFYNVDINKPSGFILNLADNDSLVAVNKMTFMQGLINNSLGRVVALDSVVHTASHLRGTAPLVFMGDGDGHWINDENGALNTSIRIQKNDPSLTVWTTSNNAILDMGQFDEHLTITRGKWAFEDIADYVHCDFASVTIEPNGTLEAWSGRTRSNSDLLETGGTFDHNFGLWEFDDPVFTDVNVTDRIDFWDVMLNKSSGYFLTMANGDSLVANNKYTSIQGYLNNPDARLIIEDSLVVAGTHLAGTCPLSFTGEKDGVWIHDETGASWPSFRMDKHALAVVQLYSQNTNLLVGATGETFHMVSGTLDVDQGAGFVDWNFEDNLFDGGTHRLTDGVTYWAGSLDMNGGQFDPQSGQWQVNTPVFSTWNLQVDVDAHDFSVNKSSGYSVTFAGPGKVQAANDLDFVAGYSYGGTIEAMGDVTVHNSFSLATTNVVFTGASDQFFDLTGAADRLDGEIELNKSTASSVWLLSDLDIEDDWPQLVLNQGYLGAVDNTLHRVRFLSTPMGWTGGNDNSYCFGFVEKFGPGGMVLPVGENGNFRPAGVHSMASTLDGVAVRYEDSPPPAGPAAVGSTFQYLSQCEHWTIGAISGNPNVSIWLTYDQDICGPYNDPAQLGVASYEGGEWVDLFGNQAGVDNIIISSGVPSVYNRFALVSYTSDNLLQDSPAGCATDLNGDGTHDTTDLLLILGEFGCTTGCTYDLTGDTNVDTADLLLFLGVFGSDC